MNDEYEATAPAAPATPAIDVSHLLKTINAWRSILNARLLALIAMIGAIVIFAFGMYEPSLLRLWGAILYSLGVLWPMVFLYLRKG